jgi:MinD-like ATPase involved in chromosome partitioning or flagellar assembly
MKTVLFYSPRGGTGRSLCLANCAAEFAKKGEKVLALDMDLEAGGLNIIFKGENADLGPHEKPIGLLKCLMSKDIEGINDAIEDLKIYEPYNKSHLKGDLHLLPIYMGPYLMDQIQSKINVPKAFDLTLKSLKQKIVAEFDYTMLLVDLPTGMNPIRETFLSMCECIVLLSRANLQGAYGTAINMDEFAERGLKAIFVLSCVPSPGKKESKVKIKDFQKRAGIIKINNIIPFDEQLAFNEEISVIKRPKSDISKVYASISRRIMEI